MAELDTYNETYTSPTPTDTDTLQTHTIDTSK